MKFTLILYSSLLCLTAALPAAKSDAVANSLKVLERGDGGEEAREGKDIAKLVDRMALPVAEDEKKKPCKHGWCGAPFCSPECQP